MTDKTPDSIKCIIDIRDVPPSAYRLPGETRKKSKYAWMTRRAVALQLATFANRDGSEACPSNGRLQAALELSRRTVQNVWTDLEALGFVTDSGRVSEFNFTKIRQLNVEKILAAKPLPPEEKQPRKKKGVQSKAAVAGAGEGGAVVATGGCTPRLHPTGFLYLPDKENKTNIKTKSNPNPYDVGEVVGVSPLINEEPNGGGEGGAVVETIGEHFGVLPTFELVTDGELNTETAAWERFEGDGQLLDACRAYVRDFADQPYLGRVTNQRVMDAAGKRYGKNTPPSWFKVIYLLKDSPGPAKVMSEEKREAAAAARQQRSIVEWAAERAARPRCPVCKYQHEPPLCEPKKETSAE